MNDSLSAFLEAEKKRYIEQCAEDGATAKGWREHISSLKTKDPLLFKKWEFEALMSAATLKWEAQARKHGEDLFSISGVTIPEYLTRPSTTYSAQEGEDEEDKYEKIDTYYATLSDLNEDAIIKMRKAAESSAAAEMKMKVVDQAKKRAKGNMSVLLRDLADKGPAIARVNASDGDAGREKARLTPAQKADIAKRERAHKEARRSVHV